MQSETPRVTRSFTAVYQDMSAKKDDEDDEEEDEEDVPQGIVLWCHSHDYPKGNSMGNFSGMGVAVEGPEQIQKITKHKTLLWG